MRQSGGMSLNGWQRLWILITGVWLILIAFLTYIGLPTTVYLPGHPGRSSAVVPEMKTPEWDGRDCDATLEVSLSDGRRIVGSSKWSDFNQPSPALIETGELKPIVERMIAGGETLDDVQAVIGRFAAKQIVLVSVPLDSQSEDARLCFAAKMSRDQMKSIAADYHDTYRRLVSNAIRERLLTMTAIAIIPPLALYALGAALGWVWRGFRQSRAS